jgi:hypothetical protein
MVFYVFKIMYNSTLLALYHMIRRCFIVLAIRSMDYVGHAPILICVCCVSRAEVTYVVRGKRRLRRTPANQRTVTLVTYRQACNTHCLMFAFHISSISMASWLLSSYTNLRMQVIDSHTRAIAASQDVDHHLTHIYVI